jgi:hypothetical protein
MIDKPRKKSPRAPSIPLDEAIDRAQKVYEKEARHAAPSDVVAQDIGYKSANNGAALAVLASMRYFGLLERPSEGKLAVSKDVETYLYAPDDEVKRALRSKWLRAPAIFADLLDAFPGELPSDANLRFDLIKRGFTPATSEALIGVFRKSAEFAGHGSGSSPKGSSPEKTDSEGLSTVSIPLNDESSPHHSQPTISIPSSNDEVDRIPVRLSGGRKAWLIIPSPFFEADKARLKAQIDFLLTEDSSDAIDPLMR